MPSIQDVADQINARLDQIATNTANTAQNTADQLVVAQDMRTQLSQIHTTLANGFANLSQGLFAQLQLQLVAVGLLDHNRKQNDTIICELVNSNELLCDIMRKFGRQLRLNEASLESVERIEGITGRVHSAEAADYDRERDLQRQLAECCPPTPPPEEECPGTCDVPAYKPTKPSGQDWKPLPTPERPDVG